MTAATYAGSNFFTDGAGRYFERFGWDFEDFAPGQRFRHRPGITLSQQDNVAESLATMNGAMIHFDEHYAAGTDFKRPLMVSTLTLQRVIGMASKTFGRRQRIHRFDEIALTRTVFGGTTLYAESEILEVDASPEGHYGLVRVKTTALESDGTPVGHFTWRAGIWRRGRCDDTHGTPARERRFASHRIEPDGLHVEQTGLFFEDFVAGEHFVHAPRRSFTEAEALWHARQAMEIAPHHHDLAWIAHHECAPIAVPETVVISAVTAATTRSFNRVVANLGWYDIELPHSVRAGDTIQVQSTVLETRGSKSRPNEGILTVATEARNQHNDKVCSFRRNLLVYRAGVGPYAAAGY